MHINVNSIVVLNYILVLGWLYRINIDLNFVFSTCDFKASKEKTCSTFHLQSKKYINLFIGLSTSNKLWED